MKSQLVKGSVSIMLMQLLKSGDMYGYQIIQQLEKNSNNFFSFKEGTLYPILHKLEQDKLIESYWEDSSSKRKRKYYHITEKGLRQFELDKNVWSEFSTAVNIILEGVEINEQASFRFFKFGMHTNQKQKSFAKS